MKKYMILLLSLMVALVGLAFFFFKEGKEVPEETVFTVDGVSLPTISFDIEGYELNLLQGYVDEVDLSSTRDTLTPLNGNGSLVLDINTYGNEILGLSYELTSLDGKKSLLQGVSDVKNEEQVILNLVNGASSIQETVLKITLELEDKNVDYYTRVLAYDQLMLKENLDFVSNIHDQLFMGEEGEALLYKHMSPSSKKGSNLNEITHESSIEEILWNYLQPEIQGQVKLEITESTPIFTCTNLSYLIKIEIEGVDHIYKIIEHYRTGYSSANKSVGLFQYKRSMEAIFYPKEQNFKDGLINLGITSTEIEFMESENARVVAFVQEKQLFSYNVEENVATQIFTFAPNLELEEDFRKTNTEHEIEILDVSEEGDIVFGVYGYMNSGPNEGRVGVGIYEYDVLEKTVEQAVFINSNRAYNMEKQELFANTYYSKEQHIIYLFANDMFYLVNLENKQEDILVEHLEKEQYLVSNDGKYIAFNSGENTLESRLSILNIAENTQIHVVAPEGEAVVPLGFIDEDVICGYVKVEQKGVDYLGVEIMPIYQLAILNKEGNIEKIYESEDKLIRSVTISDRMITLNQVVLKNGIYATAEEGYISNNISEAGEKVELSYLIDEQLLQVQVLKTNSKQVDTNLTVEKAELIYNEETTFIFLKEQESVEQFYVYAYGEMLESFKSAGEAIKLASENYGCVIDKNQNYVWRRGDRALNYNSSMESSLKSKLKSGSSVGDILIEAAGTKIINYTGATVEQMCYLINKGQRIGFHQKDGSWGIFVGYSGDIMYYLDESGTKQSTAMSRLDTNIVELIGTGIF